MERDPHREEIKATPHLWTPWTPWGTKAALRAAKGEEARMSVPVYEAGASDPGQAPN